MPNLADFDWIVVNSSAGKDSQAMLDFVVELARSDGLLSRVVVLHCDLGLTPRGQAVEWPGTKELAAEHAAHYGLRFELVRRTTRGFLEEIRRRGKFPSNKQRYCTSYFKREQGAKALTKLAREARGCGHGGPPRLLNCFGFRAEESPRRRKLPEFAANAKATSGRKHVYDWLPIQGWDAAQVWERIARAGTRAHPAYAQGMSRLSCRFCIFAPRAQLIRSGRLNPELLQEYVDLEREIGHRFTHKLSLAEVQAAVQAGEQPGADDGAWDM